MAELLPIIDSTQAQGEQIAEVGCVLNGLKQRKNQKTTPPIPSTQSQVLSFLCIPVLIAPNAL